MSTLESAYNNRIKLFQERKRNLTRLKQDLAALKPDMEKYETVRREVADIESGQSEVEYLLDVASILRGSTTTQDTNDASNSTLFDEFMCVESSSNKGQLYKQYMADVEKDPEYIAKLQHEMAIKGRRPFNMCEHCSAPLVVTNECHVCSECGLCEPLLEYTLNNLTFEQRSNGVTPIYMYKRINHFQEWLSKVQARETTVIPEFVLESLRLELKKARISDPKKITQKKIKEFLKKLDLSKYYDHVPSITNTLTGISAPRLPPQLEARLRTMFLEIEPPFQMYCPKNRKNFLSYSYVLYKFCELLGEDDYLQFFPLLKSSEKLHQADMIWKKICGYLQWEYISSV